MGVRALNWAVAEMEKRQQMLASVNVRTLARFNEKANAHPDPSTLDPDTLPCVKKNQPLSEPLPHIVIVIDGFADLTMAAGKDFESAIMRLAQKGRTTGIHLILGKKNSAGISKITTANMPAHIALQSPSSGMFYQPISGDRQEIRQVTATNVEVGLIAQHWRDQGTPQYDAELLDWLDGNRDGPKGLEGFDDSELYRRALSLIADGQRPSISKLQRELQIGFNKASWLVDRLMDDGVVTKAEITTRTKALAGTELRHDDIVGFSEIIRFSEENKVISRSPSFKKPTDFINTQYGRKIEKPDNSDSKLSVENAVRSSLVEHFIDSDTPIDEQDRLIAKVTTAILQCDRTAKGGWSEAILAESESRLGVNVHRPSSDQIVKLDAEAAPKRDQSSLPNAAPAIWKNDKLAGDAPPDFIKRHYGPWLRADALGLSRRDIKRLDPTLYTALANWLKKNELPQDCPVPNRSAKVDAELEQLSSGSLAENSPHLGRLAAAAYRRSQQKLR